MRLLRRHSRVKPSVAHPIQVQINGEGFIEVLRARDISLGGLGVHVSHHFDGCDIHSEVELVVKLPGEKPFVTRGQIRNISAKSDSAGLYGVEFVALSPEASARLDAYVARRIAEGGAD